MVAVRRPRRVEVHAAAPSTSPSRTARPSGATPRCGCRGRSGRPTATCRCCATSSTPWPPTSAGSSPSCRRPGCGTPASSSATGSTPPPRRTSPPTPRPTTGSWPPPASTAARDMAAEAAADAGPVPRTPSISADLADRTRAAFNEHYVSADGTIHSDAPTVYALAITFGLLDDRGRQLAGERLAEAGRRGRVPHPDRLRRHAVRHRRPDRAPGTSTTPTGCCCRPSARPGSTR